MKKKYSAPDIAFESFALSSSIAACDVGTNQSEGSCGYEFAPGIVIFVEQQQGCGTPTVDGSKEYNGVCYDVPTEDLKQLFSS